MSNKNSFVLNRFVEVLDETIFLVCFAQIGAAFIGSVILLYINLTVSIAYDQK